MTFNRLVYTATICLKKSEC